MGQVAAVVQLEPQDGVARFEQGQVDRLVGLGAGVGLNVGVVRAKEPFRPFDGNLLGDVHVVATTVVAFARIPFGILVGEHAAHGRQHWGGDIVLAGNQLHTIRLTTALPLNRSIEFRVRRRQEGAWVGHFSPGC